MADTPDRPQRPGGPPKGSRPGSARPSKGRPPSGDRRPSRDGDRPTGQKRDGDKPAWQKRDGDRPTGQRRDGDKPAWQKRDGDRPTGQKRDGDKPAWQKRDGDRPTGQRRDGDKPAWQKRDGKPSDRPTRDGKPSDRAGRDGHSSSQRGSERGAPRGGPRSGPRSGQHDGDEKRLWTREGNPARGDASARERETPEDRDPYGIKSVRARHDAPEIPLDVTPSQLDRVARAQLKTLSKENADEVARHLVMAARLITEDPELAHLHAVSAGRRAGRIAVVRETLAITAYSIGDFALALRELRTYRRISGRDDQLPMMVDCERGLERPERALELGRSVARGSLPVEVQVELAIAMSGARLDLGQTDAALIELELPQLNPDTAFSWSPALFDAYATVLEELGRTEEAEEWFDRSDVATAALVAKDAVEDNEEDESIEVYEEELDVEGQEVAEDSVSPDDEMASGDEATGSRRDEPNSDG